MRDVVGQDGLDRVFEVLRAPYAEEPTNWSRRYKANLEKLASGDVIKVAEVVRDLWRRERERGLSAGEKRMLAKARQILVSELALAENTNEDKAEALLDEVLASRRRDLPASAQLAQCSENAAVPDDVSPSPGAAACSCPDADAYARARTCAAYTYTQAGCVFTAEAAPEAEAAAAVLACRAACRLDRGHGRVRSRRRARHAVSVPT